MTSTNLLYIYVIIINVVTFFIYGLDKSRAKAGQWRIPEAQLIFLAVIGGSVGALAGIARNSRPTGLYAYRARPLERR